MDDEPIDATLVNPFEASREPTTGPVSAHTTGPAPQSLLLEIPFVAIWALLTGLYVVQHRTMLYQFEEFGLRLPWFTRLAVSSLAMFLIPCIAITTVYLYGSARHSEHRQRTRLWLVLFSAIFFTILALAIFSPLLTLITDLS